MDRCPCCFELDRGRASRGCWESLVHLRIHQGSSPPSADLAGGDDGANLQERWRVCRQPGRSLDGDGSKQVLQTMR